MRPGLRGLTIGFLAAFLVATMATGIATYMATLGTIDELVDRRLDTVSDLVGGTDGFARAAGMLARIDRFASRRDTGDIGFVLSDGGGRRIGGNVPLPTPLLIGFSHVDATDGITGLSAGRALTRKIGPNLFLTTIAETEPFDGYRFRRVQIQLLGFGSIILIVLAGVVAFAITIARRFAEMRRTVEAIIAGDMGRRVAVAGISDEFDRQAHAFNRMLDRIGELMDGLRNVSNDIAHDLRTPLARLRSRLVPLATRIDDPGQREAVVEAIGQCDHILGMIAAMLRIAEVEAGERVAGFAPVDIGVLLEETADTMAAVAAAQGHLLTLSGVGAIPVAGDRRLIAQALINVIENAIHHTPAGTTIAIRAVAANGAARIEIRDDGPGIPVAQHALALRRFGRLEASRHRPGHGLGLPLVAAIARLHGGEMVLADAAPGLRVILCLPLAHGAGNATGAPRIPIRS